MLSLGKGPTTASSPGESWEGLASGTQRLCQVWEKLQDEVRAKSWGGLCIVWAKVGASVGKVLARSGLGRRKSGQGSGKVLGRSCTST